MSARTTKPPLQYEKRSSAANFVGYPAEHGEVVLRIDESVDGYRQQVVDGLGLDILVEVVPDPPSDAPAGARRSRRPR